MQFLYDRFFEKNSSSKIIKLKIDEFSAFSSNGSISNWRAVISVYKSVWKRTKSYRFEYTDLYRINWLFLKVFLYIHLDPRNVSLLSFPFLRNCSFCKYEFIIGHIEELHNFSPLFIQVFKMIHFWQWRGRIKRKFLFKKWVTKKWLIIALISDLLIREVVTMIFMIGEKVSDRNQGSFSKSVNLIYHKSVQSPVKWPLSRFDRNTNTNSRSIMGP